MIATPVLLGSIIRLPMGMLADRYGGRIVYGLLLLFIAFPATMLSKAQSFLDLENARLLISVPGLLIFVTVLAVNLMGNGLRDALDPRLKQ